ncbi:hypothetical protein FE257_002544 [Aspergillus nanangensis]|uniref:Cupredoxin n=1 Tax=Aspergillus nanangensis TaxID=2582783 RepID=A0AAD4GY08_ASPNN|nr:hypothetical protein FE257_002544 [Aspergillus nanangensis]
MRKQYLIASILSWISFVAGQYGTTTTGPEMATSSPTTSHSASSSTQTVDVGEHGFTFDPDTLNVAAGDKVEFHFYPGNHSVVQADFSRPCHPLSDSSFFSGFIGPTSGESKTVFTITVNNTDPIWYYCGQIGHCQAGMVAVINPPTSGSDSLAVFKAEASNATGESVPFHVQGGTLSTESATTSSSPEATSSPTSTMSPTGTSSSSPSPSPSPSPTTTNSAANVRAYHDRHAMSICFFLVACFLM